MTEQQAKHNEKPQLAPMIQGLCPGLPEVGKIKIGMKGQMTTSRGGKQFQLPQRLDHFVVTTLERGQDGNFLRDGIVHQQLGDKPIEIPIGLLYNDPELNFQCRWACFTGTTLWCTGDGVNAYRKQKNGSETVVPCPCERSAPDFKGDQYRCKTSGVLSVMLDNMQMVGGVYKFRTTSYNSVINIMSSLALIQRVTGGVLSGIPLMLTVRPKTVIVPTTNKAMVVHIVGIEYRGSLKQLADVGYQAALSTAQHKEQIAQIETLAKQSITQHLILTEGETENDIVEEFYPESITADTTDAEVKVEHEEPRDMDAEFVEKFKMSPGMSDFLSVCAKHFNQSAEEIMASALDDPENFQRSFDDWAAKQPENGKYGDIMPKSDRYVGKTEESATDRPPASVPQNEPAAKPRAADDWDPLTAPVQKRYAGGKKERVIEELEARGVEYNPGWPGPQLHSKLLSVVAQEKVIDDNATGEAEAVAQREGIHDDSPPQPANFDPGPAGYDEPAAQPKNEGNGSHPPENVQPNANGGEPANKYFHDIDELAAMPPLLQHIYAQLAETNQCLSEELSPKSVNVTLKRRYPAAWEKARQALGFSFIAQTDEAADRWNNDIIALVEMG